MSTRKIKHNQLRKHVSSTVRFQYRINAKESQYQVYALPQSIFKVLLKPPSLLTVSMCNFHFLFCHFLSAASAVVVSCCFHFFHSLVVVFLSRFVYLRAGVNMVATATEIVAIAIARSSAFLMCFYWFWSVFRIRMHRTTSTAMIQIQCLRIMVIINTEHDVLAKWLPLHLTVSVVLVLHIMPASEVSFTQSTIRNWVSAQFILVLLGPCASFSKSYSYILFGSMDKKNTDTIRRTGSKHSREYNNEKT